MPVGRVALHQGGIQSYCRWRRSPSWFPTGAPPGRLRYQDLGLCPRELSSLGRLLGLIALSPPPQHADGSRLSGSTHCLYPPLHHVSLSDIVSGSSSLNLIFPSVFGQHTVKLSAIQARRGDWPILGHHIGLCWLYREAEVDHLYRESSLHFQS